MIAALKIKKRGVTLFAVDFSTLGIISARIAQHILPVDRILFHGELGVGKTEMARSILKCLKPNLSIVPSPTFSIIHTYQFQHHGQQTTCWHADLHRIRNIAEVQSLDILEQLYSGIMLIEWPEIIMSLIPNDFLSVHLYTIPQNNETRCLTFSAAGHWKKKLHFLTQGLPQVASIANHEHSKC